MRWRGGRGASGRLFAGRAATAGAEVGRPVLLVRGDAPPVEVGVVEALEGGPANPLLRVRVDGA